MRLHICTRIYFSVVSRNFSLLHYPLTKWHQAAFHRHCRWGYLPFAKPTCTNRSQGFLFSPDGVRVGSVAGTKPAYFCTDPFWKTCWQQHVKSRAVKSCLLCVNWVFHSISQLSGKDSHPPYAPRLLPQAPSKQLKTSPDTSQLFFFIYIIMPRNLDSSGFVLHSKTIYNNTGPGTVSSACILSLTRDLIHKHSSQILFQGDQIENTTGLDLLCNFWEDCKQKAT